VAHGALSGIPASIGYGVPMPRSSGTTGPSFRGTRSHLHLSAAHGRRLTVATITIAAVTAGMSVAYGAAPPGVPPTSSPPGPSPWTGGVGHVFVIMMENHGFDDLVGDPAAPWVNAAVARYGVARRSFAVTHPSQPNYVAATSGSTQGVTDDLDVTIDAPNVVDRVEAANRTWTAYMQSLSACGGDVLRSFCGHGLYARKHDPFASYLDIQQDPVRLSHIVDLGQLSVDLAAGTVPDLAWISPDQCHDMHGVPGQGDTCDPNRDDLRIAAGDAFLEATVDQVMASSSWTHGSIMFITWDEAGGSDASGCCGEAPGGGHILTIVISHDAPGPIQSDVAYNHYSLLASIQVALDLGCLGATCDTTSVRPMTDLMGQTDGAGLAIPSASP
jgi:phosphatidylinositol-3-phosphatase